LDVYKLEDKKFHPAGVNFSAWSILQEVTDLIVVSKVARHSDDDLAINNNTVSVVSSRMTCGISDRKKTIFSALHEMNVNLSLSILNPSDLADYAH
jgi:hypothetical protein